MPRTKTSEHLVGDQGFILFSVSLMAFEACFKLCFHFLFFIPFSFPLCYSLYSFSFRLFYLFPPPLSLPREAQFSVLLSGLSESMLKPVC